VVVFVCAHLVKAGTDRRQVGVVKLV
jgi:hypothetical protein